MEANLPGAERTAYALHQPAHGEGDQRSPHSDGHQQEEQQTDVEPFGSGGGLIQRAGTILLLVGIGITQLVWVALIAYATYSIWQRLPV
jgi:hypothetical protein